MEARFNNSQFSYDGQTSKTVNNTMTHINFKYLTSTEAVVISLPTWYDWSQRKELEQGKRLWLLERRKERDSVDKIHRLTKGFSSLRTLIDAQSSHVDRFK
jgi:phage gp46-like protein